MKRLLLYKPAAQRELGRMGRSDAERIVLAVETFAATGRGDVKALRGVAGPLPLARRQMAFTLDQVGSVVVSDIDNRGQAC